MAELELELEPPPAKRRKPSEAMESPENTQFWFQDGDIVLGVEEKYLKVHRAKLMASLVFSTMLALPQPALTETLHDCPFVKLPHDTLHDWTPVLDWMYDRSSFELRSASLDIMARALRISTKYEILELRQWCKEQLLSKWPPNLIKMNSTALPNAAEAICLAREFDIPEILPAAFYALAIQRWENGLDGGRSHLILSPEDLRRLIVGREKLQERLTALLVNWDPCRNSQVYNVCYSCQPTFLCWLPERLLPVSRDSTCTSWLIHDLDELSKGHFIYAFPCKYACADILCLSLGRFLSQLQDDIPTYLCPNLT